MSIIESVLARSRTVIATLALILMAGSAAYLTIPKEAEPDVDIPFIVVSVTLEGVAPEDAERLLVRPLEEELRGVEEVKEMRASAFEGGATVILEFIAGFDADQALQDVRDAVDKARPELPEAAEEPLVDEITTSLFPVVVVVLSGDVPERALIRIARDLRDDVEALPSVLEANLSGDREEVVEVVIDPVLVESYGLNAGDVAAFFNRSNRLVAAGDLQSQTGSFAVKVPGLFETVEDVLSMPVKANGNAIVYVRDIAAVRRTFKDPTAFARLDGLPAVALEISKRTGENIIDTIRSVRSVVDDARSDWPTGIRITYTQDQSEFIEMMLKDLENQVLIAVLLVMAVVVGVLGFRSAMLVGIAVPGSFLTSILVLQLLGMTVNMVVLFALILSVGLLVDGAIIVTEYADRKMADGLDRRAAYIAASKRMAAPVIAGTATTLVAFMPLLFWPGVVGEFMVYFPITLLATLTAALAMALIFVPTLGAIFGRPGTRQNLEWQHQLVIAESGDLSRLQGFTGYYLKALHLALRYPGQVLLITTALLIAVWHTYAVYGKGIEFFPDVESDFAIVFVHARGNLSIYQKDQLMKEVEQRVLSLNDEFLNVYTTTGVSGGFGRDLADDVIGQISIELKDWDQRRPADEILADIRAITSDVAGVRIETRQQEAGPPVGKPIQVELSADDPDLLPQAVAQVRAFMEDLPGLKDIEDDRPLPGIELVLDIDRAQAATYGLDVTAVGETVRLVSNGLVIGTYRPDDADDEIDISVRYPEADRSVEKLDQIRVITPQGAVPVSNFASLSAEQKVGELERADGRRVMAVRADVAPGVLVNDKVEQIRAWLEAEQPLGPAVTYEFKGQREEQQAAQQFLINAFIIALFLMAIILVTQFNSFYSAFLVLSAVIFSTIGAVIGLLVTDQAFGVVVTGIGMIALAGVVVNNNIVLIDTYNRLLRRTGDIKEAILRTGVLRLRPVILTTATTVLGLLAMMLKINIDLIARDVSYGAPATQWWSSLATVIVFGLSFATVLTLIVTPSALMLKHLVRQWISAWRTAPKEG